MPLIRNSVATGSPLHFSRNVTVGAGFPIWKPALKMDVAQRINESTAKV
jgi:hypothetical protein